MLQVSAAILFYPQADGSRLYLLQLRDDIPTILSPGKWGLFGGAIEPGETPDQAMHRELMEEIGADADVAFSKRYDLPNVVRHIYAGTPRVEFSKLVLSEGKDMGLFTQAQIMAGALTSTRLGITREQVDALPTIMGDYFDTLVR